eukprot:CAMPEP_0119077448 /NCGR_PEP_ID=MMETSP1178-20130426/95140_1 /TAXON_ID=33656 /ORGANISM="unid sp, Strain CCMP2000" /LENGTH=50 /DNA_ID=CAMNT_0007059807 /DNA_START=24 /DNA_END=173 /DNA_ORIENTATION=-
MTWTIPPYSFNVCVMSVDWQAAEFERPTPEEAGVLRGCGATSGAFLGLPP